MLDLLMERDREEALRTDKRHLSFPDGTTRPVIAYRLVWCWFDHLMVYEFCVGEEVLLRDVLEHSKKADVPITDALGAVVQSYVTLIEATGGDITDHDLQRLIAQKAASIKAR